MPFRLVLILFKSVKDLNYLCLMKDFLICKEQHNFDLSSLLETPQLKHVSQISADSNFLPLPLD